MKWFEQERTMCYADEQVTIKSTADKRSDKYTEDSLKAIADYINSSDKNAKDPD